MPANKKRPARDIPPEVLKEMQQLASWGVSQEQIARQKGYSPATVSRALQKAKEAIREQ